MSCSTWRSGCCAAAGRGAPQLRLHDLKRSKETGPTRCPWPSAGNLWEIVERLRRCGATLLFASTTPILDDRHARRKADFDRTQADVARYNAVALAVMGELGARWTTCTGWCRKGGPEGLLSGDGTLHPGGVRPARRGGRRLRPAGPHRAPPPVPGGSPEGPDGRRVQGG